jgi:hypothetical protein
MPEVDLVEVHLENAVLGVAPLELEGEHRLLQLSLQALVGRQEQQLGELLGDRAAALDHPAAAVVLDRRARDADRVDAPVVVEALVFCGNDGVAKRLRNVGQGHEDATLDVQLGDELVVVIVDLGADERLEGLQSRDRG